MKTRAFLPLIEHIFMIAVFAISAAVCIGCFSLSKTISTEIEYKDKAVILAQNTAESVKKNKGIYHNTEIGYTNSLTTTDIDTAEYIVTISPIECNNPLLGSAKICIKRYGHTLYTLTTCWQEEFVYDS